MSRRQGSTNSLVRRPGNRPARKAIVGIAYDGEKTEAEYFHGWSRKLGPSGIVVLPFYVMSGGNVRDAVGQAIKKFDKDGGVDEKWCVCDVDDTSVAHLSEAIKAARAANIKLCLSTRCFEVWIALHWERISTAPISCERDAIALVQKRSPRYSAKQKSLPFSELYDRTDAACRNAAWLRSTGFSNPATDVDLLIERLRQLSKS